MKITTNLTQIHIVTGDDINPESQNDALSNFIQQLSEFGIETIICEGCNLDTYFTYNNGDLALFDKSSDKYLRLDWAKELKSHLSRRYTLSKEPLFRALKLKGDAPDSNFVVDASLGTGKDACLLLSFKCHLLCFERNAYVFSLALWAYLKACASKDDFIASIFKDRMTLVYGEATTCTAIDERYNKCFFDPMYEAKTKSALSRKEMEVFKKLVGNDPDQELYLTQLIEKFHFVCLKRPVKAKTLLNTTSSYQLVSFSGKSTRYDRYFIP